MILQGLQQFQIKQLLVSSSNLNDINTRINANTLGDVQTLSNNVTYTATSDGYVWISAIAYNSEGYGIVVMNNNRLLAVNSRASYPTITPSSGSVFVKKGMVFSVTLSNFIAKFFPIN